jgi:diadenosine tetraphosphate (Ap4A) HIT family hydrolase
MTDEVQRSPYLRRLPIGERLPLGEVAHDELFPLEGQILVKALEAPILPEPHRRGEAGREPCWNCEHQETDVIWSDERWLVRANPAEPHGLPAVVVLLPREHHDLNDLPPELAAGLGVMIRRVSRAISRLPDVGRVHVNRWGDGSEHFHVWFLARPRGMWQMRGAMLAVWDDILPKVPLDEWQANIAAIAAALHEQAGAAGTEPA